MIYTLIGKLVVRAGRFYVAQKWGRQLQFGAGFLAVAIGIGAYLASRDVQEG